MLIPRIQEQVELDLETAHGQVAAGYVNSVVSEDMKMLAAAIEQAGASIAPAISSRNDESS